MLLTNANGSIILKMINEIVAANKQEYKMFISKVRLIICLLSLNSKALDFEINKNRFLTGISEYRVFSYIFLEPTTTFGISNYFFSMSPPKKVRKTINLGLKKCSLFLGYKSPKSLPKMSSIF